MNNETNLSALFRAALLTIAIAVALAAPVAFCQSSPPTNTVEDPFIDQSNPVPGYSVLTITGRGLPPGSQQWFVGCSNVWMFPATASWVPSDDGSMQTNWMSEYAMFTWTPPQNPITASVNFGDYRTVGGSNDGYPTIAHVYYRGWTKDAAPDTVFFHQDWDWEIDAASTASYLSLSVILPAFGGHSGEGSFTPSVSNDVHEAFDPRYICPEKIISPGSPGPPPNYFPDRNGLFSLFNVVSGSTYTVQSSTNLSNWVTETNITVGASYTNGWQDFQLNMTSRTEPVLYFRFSGTNWLNN